MTQLGTGIVTLLGNNTYTGGTTISAGTLQVGNGGGAPGTPGPGSIAGNVLDNAALVFDVAGNVTFAGAISGSGGLAQAGTGVLSLLGSNSYTGQTTISAGTLQVGNGGPSGSIAGNVLDNSALVFNLSTNTTFAGVISGSGGLTQVGGGILTLLGSNTYTGNTMVSAGTLQVGNGGSGEFLASSSVSLGNSTALVFSHSDTLTYSGVVSGGGGLDAGRSRTADPAGQQYLHGPHDNLRRHATNWITAGRAEI